MSTLKVPSLQHLARCWRNTPGGVSKELLKVVKNKPQFTYEPLNKAAKDFVLYKIPEEDIAKGIQRFERRENVRNILLDVLPYLCSYLSHADIDFPIEVEDRYYPISRTLKIPFRPSFLYVSGETLYFPWFIFWKTNPLTEEQLSLFITIVDELLLQDPALENARFQIIDLSAKKRSEFREVHVIDSSTIPKLSPDSLKEKLEIFAQGFHMAKKELSKQSENIQKERPSIIIDERQNPLWPLDTD